jgi:pimeloyl-ACP methyl ester carboxylesterase
MPPLWSEGRIGLELAALMRSRVWKGDGVEHAGGQPVLLIPGFLAGDGSLGQMTQWLRRTGHRTSKAGIRSNIDCSSKAVDRLGERLEVMAEANGQRVAVIGQSRGGNFAKVLAARHPDLVSGIVTLGSPQLDPFAIHPLVRMQVFAVGTLGMIGLRGFFKHSCRSGQCCERFWEELAGPLRSDVGYLSVYSKRDGIVDWRACLDPHAEQLEISASHCGMAVNALAYLAIAQALSEFRAAGSPRRIRKPVKQQAPRLRRAA